MLEPTASAHPDPQRLAADDSPGLIDDPGTLPAGTLVGPYRIERPLAEGGMATVYEAVHEILPRRAAVKVLHRGLLGRWSTRERLFQEARILESFDHPGLVRIFDVGLLPDDRPWIAMELVAGVTLAERLTVHRVLDPGELAEVLDVTAAALAAAHRTGVIHRDLKPENIIITRGEPGAMAIKVIDWGIARVQDPASQRLTRANMTPGTPLYMSPEQARGKATDGSSDVYTLGVIAWEALCGDPPFSGDGPIEVVLQHLTVAPPTIRPRRPEVPVALEALVLQMLAKDPGHRPSIAAIRSRLAAILADLREEPDVYEELSVVMELEAEPASEPDAADLALPLGARPRWTPRCQPIVPGGGCAAVAGEIDGVGRRP
jgi:eukaryotic-like serine/threonine-protein kinase